MKKKYSIFSLIKNSLSYHENWEKTWKDPEPKKEYEIVIIGGGGHGLATAYYLAKKHDLKNITKGGYTPPFYMPFIVTGLFCIGLIFCLSKI